jgi:hypothetical protein
MVATDDGNDICGLGDQAMAQLLVERRQVIGVNIAGESVCEYIFADLVSVNGQGRSPSI